MAEYYREIVIERYKARIKMASNLFNHLVKTTVEKQGDMDHESFAKMARESVILTEIFIKNFEMFPEGEALNQFLKELTANNSPKSEA